MTRFETRDAIIQNRKDSKKTLNNTKETQIPEPYSIGLEPPKPIVGDDILNNKTTISFSVTEQVPLKDVLIELGRAAKIDVDLDSNISGGIVINARNRPLGEVIDRIAELGNLRYNYDKGVLHFRRDSPYVKNYFVDYLFDGSILWAEVSQNLSTIITNNSASVLSEKSASDTSVTTAIPTSSITLNKTAGIMSIFATQRQHKEIATYLADVEKSASAQVLIEAKVVEVALNDEFKTGIDWSWSDFASNGRSVAVDVSNGFTQGNPLGIVFSGDITASVSALEKFGTSRTLSSPRIHAINNQKAILNFAKKLIYFKLENTQTNAAGGNNNTVTAVATTRTSTKIEIDVGVELIITPSINLETNEITLNVAPKITAEFGERILDPASPTDDAGVITVRNEVPQIKTRELKTIAKVQSGNILVIGGLMEESTSNTDTGIPFLQRIPILGYLFKSTSKVSETTETVIFIKATIVNSGSQPHKVDRDIQEKFDTNRRRFF